MIGQLYAQRHRLEDDDHTPDSARSDSIFSSTARGVQPDRLRLARVISAHSFPILHCVHSFGLYSVIITEFTVDLASLGKFSLTKFFFFNCFYLKIAHGTDVSRTSSRSSPDRLVYVG